MASPAVTLTPHEALSGVAGSISLAAWIFLLVPQLIENYKQGSAEGISLAFLAVWFIGDVANLFGAIWAGLVPTVIALAIYFCFSDLVLILQCLYYNFINSRRRDDRRKHSTASTQTGVEDEDPEDQPLLARTNSGSMGLPGSHSRRRSSASRAPTHRDSLTSSLPDIMEEKESRAKEWTKNGLCIVLICIVGAAGWAIAWKTGVWRPSPEHMDDDSGVNEAVGAQVLGYLSAVCYLGARIPQIAKNYRERSCDGLSLLFFILSLMGNATYGAGILFHSLQRDYLLTNLPWLIGSLGTMVEDVVIFVQFRIYSTDNTDNNTDETAVE
ncbi:MAG: hypothetical protein M4579_004782 [Chaenotheca gracillima]|nr:MAG: hypothetical protein M4579_004782 [Chaenotheca gracillima]